jgi:hypothetical protein
LREQDASAAFCRWTHAVAFGRGGDRAARQVRVVCRRRGRLLGRHFPGREDAPFALLHEPVRPVHPRHRHVVRRARRAGRRPVPRRLALAWNDKKKRIEYYIWGSDGSYSRHYAYYSGDELVFPVEDRNDPAKVAFRSVWRRVDPSSIEVRREVPEGEGWKTELTVLYRKHDLESTR